MACFTPQPFREPPPLPNQRYHRKVGRSTIPCSSLPNNIRLSGDDFFYVASLSISQKVSCPDLSRQRLVVSSAQRGSTGPRLCSAAFTTRFFEQNRHAQDAKGNRRGEHLPTGRIGAGAIDDMAEQGRAQGGGAGVDRNH